MAWCRQATSHYLSQCWPISLSPYDVTRPQWANIIAKKTFSSMNIRFERNAFFFQRRIFISTEILLNIQHLISHGLRLKWWQTNCMYWMNSAQYQHHLNSLRIEKKWFIYSYLLARLFVDCEYGPVTMIVPASGHQVCCIPWVQMGTFNKEVSFLGGLKFFALNIFCGEYLQSGLHLMLQIWWKPLLWKMCQ